MNIQPACFQLRVKGYGCIHAAAVSRANSSLMKPCCVPETHHHSKFHVSRHQSCAAFFSSETRHPKFNNGSHDYSPPTTGLVHVYNSLKSVVCFVHEQFYAFAKKQTALQAFQMSCM